MSYKKMLFAIGIGEEVRERIHAALLISKYYGAHLDIVRAEPLKYEFTKVGYHTEEINKIIKEREEEGYLRNENIINEEAKKLGITLSDTLIEEKSTTRIIKDTGDRNKFIVQESKYSDLILVASPPNGKVNETFEKTITRSGRPIIMFPRKMSTFNTENILIGWNNSAQVSRAVSLAIPLLQKAKNVHIITSKEYTKEISHIKKLQEYLKFHNIDASYEIVTTTLIPGEALLKKSREGNFDMIVAGAFGTKGFIELMLGGTTEYILEKTKIPIFMSH